MSTAVNQPPSASMHNDGVMTPHIEEIIRESWSVIAPFWPLKSLIAVNPLKGLEHLAFEQAVMHGSAYFQQKDIPSPMHAVNRETIKWLQVFFDEGQATFKMPMRTRGLYGAWKELAQYDRQLHANRAEDKAFLAALPDCPQAAIGECLLKLSIPREDRLLFLTLMLTTLPGWAAHIRYRTQWMSQDSENNLPVSQADYLALRLATACIVWPQAKLLVGWHQQALTASHDVTAKITSIKQDEDHYRSVLLGKLASQALAPSHAADAQLVFCIDVRSEPFRRALERQGKYETFGFAGFFGVPVSIENATTGESHPSCPVLLTPSHHIVESPCSEQACKKDRAGHARLSVIKRLYQAVKYNFTSPFALVETLGPGAGVWMALRSFAPAAAVSAKRAVASCIYPPLELTPAIQAIPFENQCTYAQSALRMIGLTANFAPVVVFCGHGSATQNNAYATALDCGACGGHHGAGNARILADILNQQAIRDFLSTQGIIIPKETLFVAAEHNTTTDEVCLYPAKTHDTHQSQLAELEDALDAARKANSAWRACHMGYRGKPDLAHLETSTRSMDWAQVRPEWGLARNASFIVAPRSLTRTLDLGGRSFLHSYDWKQDDDGSCLTTILTAPMVVAQWINCQYLFSTFDNVAYGAGSKITKNVTGKIGIMQGNASDLMHGLPLQSIYKDDTQPYHEPVRLLTVVHAPRSRIDRIIASQPVLQTLFGNGWVTLVCLCPEERKTYCLERDLTWQIPS